jgi:methionyl aminopeptidase
MTVESDRDLAGLRKAGRVVALGLAEMKANLQPGMTTAELDGYIADAAVTVSVPPSPTAHERLRDGALAAFGRAVAVARVGRPLNKIGRAVETTTRRQGFTVFPDLSGHGVGRTIHEYPTIPNYYDRRLKMPLREGLVITIEPIISSGSNRTIGAEDGWTIKTADGSPAAHYEHTIVITRGSPMLLTAA